MKMIAALSLLLSSMTFAGVYNSNKAGELAKISLNQKDAEKLLVIMANSPEVKVEIKDVRTTREVIFTSENATCTEFLDVDTLKSLATTCTVKVLK